MSHTLVKWPLPNQRLSMACAGKHTNKKRSFFFCEEEMRCPTCNNFQQLVWALFWVLGRCNTQPGLDRGAPCHVCAISTVFTCYTAAHLRFVPTHYSNLLSLCGNNVIISPLTQTTSALFKTICGSTLSFIPSVHLPLTRPPQPPYHL